MMTIFRKALNGIFVPLYLDLVLNQGQEEQILNWSYPCEKGLNQALYISASILLCRLDHRLQRKMYPALDHINVIITKC